MRAIFGETGPSIYLEPQDKNDVEQGKTLACIVDDYKRPILCLEVVDIISGDDESRDDGISMQYWPPNVGQRNSTLIFVDISRGAFNRLITVYDKEAGGGFYCARTKYDRIHLTYYMDDDFGPGK